MSPWSRLLCSVKRKICPARTRCHPCHEGRSATRWSKRSASPEKISFGGECATGDGQNEVPPLSQRSKRNGQGRGAEVPRCPEIWVAFGDGDGVSEGRALRARRRRASFPLIRHASPTPPLPPGTRPPPPPPLAGTPAGGRSGTARSRRSSRASRGRGHAARDRHRRGGSGSG
jgi:hypothetical protein